ncbi:unnamed protein product [Brassica rapa subsp. trilocularis]
MGRHYLWPSNFDHTRISPSYTMGYYGRGSSRSSC